MLSQKNGSVFPSTKLSGPTPLHSMICIKCFIEPIRNALRRSAKEGSKPNAPDSVNAQHSNIGIPTLPVTNHYDSPEPQGVTPAPPQISVFIPNDPDRSTNEDVAPPTPNALTPLHSSRRNSDSSSHRSHDGNVSQNSRSRSSSKHSPTTESLKVHLRNARKECPQDSQLFIVPICAQESLITVDVVAEQIRVKNNLIVPEEAVKLAEETCRSARQLFAILAYMKKGAEIYPLLEEGVSDQDLPLERRPGDPEPFALQRRTGEPIRTIEKWSSGDLEKFGRVQWWMIAPVFEEREHYDLHDNTILPFIECDAETEKLSQGGYSEVYSVRVHPTHHKFWKRSASENDEPWVAIKRLFSPDVTEFLKEQSILKALSCKRHPHLIQLLATYRYKQKYHLMFPYANANLRKYWEDRSSPSFDEATVLWSLEQMTGIANALSQIHNFKVTYPLSVDGPGQVRVQEDANLSVRKGEEMYGRHGDIKPENILWFEQVAEAKDKNGVLKIADFGLGRFHGRDSRSKVRSYPVLCSPTYEPPECKLRRPVSRAYDIWSLGCVYLEFITWLLKGSEEIVGFSDFRGILADTGINDDNFFTITTDPINGSEAVVRQKVIDWVNQLHEHEKCSAVIHQLLDLIMKDLLVVDSTERINAPQLFQKLDDFLKGAEKDKQYLLEPVPRRRKTDDGVRSKSEPAIFHSPKLNTKKNVTFSSPEKFITLARAQPKPPRDLVLRDAPTKSTALRSCVTWPTSH